MLEPAWRQYHLDLEASLDAGDHQQDHIRARERLACEAVTTTIVLRSANNSNRPAVCCFEQRLKCNTPHKPLYLVKAVTEGFGSGCGTAGLDHHMAVTSG